MAGLPTEPLALTEGLKRGGRMPTRAVSSATESLVTLQETSGRAQWLGQETGHNETGHNTCT